MFEKLWQQARKDVARSMAALERAGLPAADIDAYRATLPEMARPTQADLAGARSERDLQQSTPVSEEAAGRSDAKPPVKTWKAAQDDVLGSYLALQKAMGEPAASEYLSRVPLAAMPAELSTMVKSTSPEATANHHAVAPGASQRMAITASMSPGLNGSPSAPPPAGVPPHPASTAAKPMVPGA